MHYNFSCFLLPNLYYLRSLTLKNAVFEKKKSLFLGKKFFQLHSIYCLPLINKEFVYDLENTAKKAPPPGRTLFSL